MADTSSSPHDAYFKQVMGRPADIAGELRAVLPEALVARLDWTDLELQPCSFISQDLASCHSDLLFRTRLNGNDAFVYLLIEHQSRPDPLMAMRMLQYMIAIWVKYTHDHRGSTELPVVIPLVVHASPRGARWHTPTAMTDLFRLDSATRDALGDLLPRFRFALDDLAAVELPALYARDLTPAAQILLVLLKVATGNQHLDRDLLPLLDYLRALLAAPGGMDDLNCVVTYILTVGETSITDLKPVINQLGPDAKEVIVTTAERLRAEGEARGRAEGEARGRVHVAEILLGQLAAKFGPVPADVALGVRRAGFDQLGLWASRVLNATSLDAVFKD
ncbi:Rpn family recombination-promoting nuclease/putative transposase [Nocardia goodfellowii]|uniref:Transposase YdaD n=1 Tax=Nocardia goodfellowii TaxID=882446 RepID=A0ABS4QCE9_9NOCA|nr:Rpn family recombination-promoting nuclease/putative transposase [Nocardia goodfellowii]MBP2189362.1 putative transposase YdaD [Nocardia goodfellowii]